MGKSEKGAKASTAKPPAATASRVRMPRGRWEIMDDMVETCLVHLRVLNGNIAHNRGFAPVTR